MKKVLTTSLAVAAFLAANAADYTVYNNGSVSAGLQVQGWYAAGMDLNAANPTGGDTKVYSFKADNGGADASMGILASGTDGAVTGPLHSATLNFDWYAVGTATCTVRLTAMGMQPEQNYDWTVTADNAGKWNQMSIDVATAYPEIAKFWDNYDGKGQGYVFSIIISGASADFNIYFDNIRYTNIDEAWQAPSTPELVPPTTVPAVAQPKDEVLSIFSEYGNHSFGIGQWGQATTTQNVTIDGKEAAELKNFNYLGWELNPAVDVTDYKYIHVDFYPCEETTFGFTIISPGQEKAWIAPEVKLNEWNSYDAPLSFWTNVDLSNVFQLKFDQGKFAQCYIANVYFYGEEDENGGNGGGNGGENNGEAKTYVYETSGVFTQNLDGEKEYPYTLNFEVIYTEAKTLAITATYVFSNGAPVGIDGGSVNINGPLYNFNKNIDGNTYTYTYTTPETYEEGQVINLGTYIPVALGVVADSFAYTVGSVNVVSGVEAIEVADEAPAYYTIQGIRVANPEKGLYIKVHNGKVSKVIL